MNIDNWILNDSMSLGNPSPLLTHKKNIFMHFWMNWDIFDDFQFKCFNFIFFSKSLNPGGVTHYSTNQISLALGASEP